MNHFFPLSRELSAFYPLQNEIRLFWLLIVAFVWGLTNPLMKRGSKGIEKIQRDSSFLQFLAEMRFLMLRPSYAIPFLINISGSVLYYITLGDADIALAVPVANSLTFVFTLLMSQFLGEGSGNLATYAGMCFVTLGVTICIGGKMI